MIMGGTAFPMKKRARVAEQLNIYLDGKHCSAAFSAGESANSLLPLPGVAQRRPFAESTHGAGYHSWSAPKGSKSSMFFPHSSPSSSFHPMLEMVHLAGLKR